MGAGNKLSLHFSKSTEPFVTHQKYLRFYNVKYYMHLGHKSFLHRGLNTFYRNKTQSYFLKLAAALGHKHFKGIMQILHTFFKAFLI